MKGYIYNQRSTFPLPLSTSPPELLTCAKDVKKEFQTLSSCAGLLSILKIVLKFGTLKMLTVRSSKWFDPIIEVIAGKMVLHPGNIMLE